MSSYIVALETADVVATATDALFTAFCPTKYLTDGMGHCLIIIRIDIQGIRSASLFQTGTSAGYHGQSATDGLDDRDAETLVT